MSSKRSFNKRADFTKALNTLTGILKGIELDGVILKEVQELNHWLEVNAVFQERPPFDEIYKTLQAALEDNVLTADEIDDIHWACQNIGEDNPYFEAITADMQILHGILHGALADNEITDLEIENLENWLLDNEELAGHYPYDELVTLLTHFLNDGKIDEDERNYLKFFFSEFIYTTQSLNINKNEIDKMKAEMTVKGICATCPDILFDGRKFCFTGESRKLPRNEIWSLIEENNGIVANGVTNDLNYLIIGDAGSKAWAFTTYGRIVEKALQLRKNGKQVIIVHENDFWDAIEDIKAGIK